MQHVALTVVFTGLFVAAMVSFLMAGARQYRRTCRLRRRAEELGLRFSHSDPFDVPNRYANFALMAWELATASSTSAVTVTVRR